jgi:hypothetical protein
LLLLLIPFIDCGQSATQTLPWFPGLEVEVARSLVIAAVNEAGEGAGVSGGSGSGVLVPLGSRGSSDAGAGTVSPMHGRPSLFTGSSGPVTARLGAHPDADRLLAKAALLLRLTALLLEAQGDTDTVMRTVPPLLARSLGCKACALALVSKNGRQLFTWTPATTPSAPGSTENLFVAQAQAQPPPAPPLVRQRVPVDGELAEAVRHALAAPRGGPSGQEAPMRPLLVFSQHREHRLLFPLLAPNAAGSGTPAAGVAVMSVDSGSVGSSSPTSSPPVPQRRIAHRMMVGDGAAPLPELPAAAADAGLLGVLVLRRRVAFSPAELDLVEGAGRHLVHFLCNSRRPRPRPPTGSADALGTARSKPRRKSGSAPAGQAAP